MKVKNSLLHREKSHSADPGHDQGNFEQILFTKSLKIGYLLEKHI